MPISHISAHGFKEIDTAVIRRSMQKRQQNNSDEIAEQEHSKEESKCEEYAVGIHTCIGFEDRTEQVKGQNDFDYNV